MIRHKSRAESSICGCGAAAEDSQHAYLECSLHDSIREPLDRALSVFCKAADLEEAPFSRRRAMTWVHTNSPELTSAEAAAAGVDLRAAALSFYAGAQSYHRDALPLPAFRADSLDEPGVVLAAA